MNTPDMTPGVRVLAIIPPMTQLNTPYPSTAYLTGFLRAQGVVATQEDLALALILRLLSRDGLSALQAHITTENNVADDVRTGCDPALALSYNLTIR